MEGVHEVECKYRAKDRLGLSDKGKRKLHVVKTHSFDNDYQTPL